MSLRCDLGTALALPLCLLVAGCDAFLGDWRIEPGATASSGSGGSGGGGGSGGATAGPLPAWCRFYGTAADETIWDVRPAPDGLGLVGAGRFSDELPFDASIVAEGASDGFLARFDLQGEPTDAAPLGANGDGVLNVAAPVAPDRVIGFGIFQGTAGAFTSDASGNPDLVVTDFAMGPIFAAGTPGVEWATDGDVFGDRFVLTGASSAGLDFGTGPLTSGGFVALLDLETTQIDAAVALGAGSSPGAGHMSRFDTSGNVWASAVLGGPGVTDLVCGGEPLVTAAPGQSAIFELAPDGTCTHGRVLPTSLLEDADLALIDGTSPVLSGRFLGKLDVDGFHAESSGTESDAFLLFFDEEAKATGLTVYGGLGAEKPNEVVVSPAGFVFVVGEFAGELVVGDIHAMSLEDNDDMFVLKFSEKGEAIWLRAFGGTGLQSATALTFDAAGDLFVGGNAEGTLACASPAPETSGGADFYLMRFDADTL